MVSHLMFDEFFFSEKCFFHSLQLCAHHFSQWFTTLYVKFLQTKCFLASTATSCSSLFRTILTFLTRSSTWCLLNFFSEKNSVSHISHIHYTSRSLLKCMLYHMMFLEFLFEKKVFSYPLQFHAHLNCLPRFMNFHMWYQFAQISPAFQAKDFHLLQIMSSIGVS